MQYGGMISASDCRAYGCQRSLCVLLGKVHRYLASLCDIPSPFGRVETLAVDVEIVAYDLNNVVYGYLVLRQLYIDLQYVLCQRSGDLAAEERGVGYERREGSLYLADIGRYVFGEVVDHFVRYVGSDALSLAARCPSTQRAAYPTSGSTACPTSGGG